MVPENDPLYEYLRDIHRIAQMSVAETNRLALSLRAGRGNPIKRRNRIVRGNLRLAVWAARRYQRKFFRVPLEDLVQAANLGLLSAAVSFDPNRESTFSTWAHYSMYREMQYAEVRSRLIRIPFKLT